MSTTIEILDKTPFKRTHIGVGNLPSAYLDSLSYYEQLSFLTDYIINTILPKVNENITQTNKLTEEFQSVKDALDKAEEDMAVLTQKVLDLSAELALKIQEVKDYCDLEIETEIAKLTVYIQNLLTTSITNLDEKYDKEVERLDKKIETFPISHLIVQNSIRGTETTLQIYLDDITELLRRGGITAEEYDNLELTADEYDVKELTAYDYDFYGQMLLTGSSETTSIILYNQTGQNTDGAMTQKAVTDALEGAGGGGSIEFSIHHNFPFASFGIGYDGYMGSGLVKCDETANGLVLLHGNFSYMDLNGVKGNYTLSQIENSEYYGCFLGTIDYKPSSIKKIERTYNFLNGDGGNTITNIMNAIAPYYLPLIIDTNGNIYVYATEGMMDTPEIPVSTNAQDDIIFNSVLLDVKNAEDLINQM